MSARGAPPGERSRARAASVSVALALALGASVPALAAGETEWTGPAIIEESQRRHEQFPYVYEEQTMVLIDAAGHRDVRRCRFFSRFEADGTGKLLLAFDDPAEIRGVALLASRADGGGTRTSVYLPAFGPELKRPGDDAGAGRFLGTDFAVGDLTPDVMQDFRYLRSEDRSIDDRAYFVVEAYPANAAVERATGYGLRRLTIRKDTFVVTETDYYDRALRFVKRLTRHDLKRVAGESWRANMLVMNDEREGHRTLLKVDRRVYSRDYVPAEIFEPGYVTGNRHVAGAAVGDEPEEDGS